MLDYKILKDDQKKRALNRAAHLIETPGAMDHLTLVDWSDLEYAASILRLVAEGDKSPAKFTGTRPPTIHPAHRETLRYKWLAGDFTNRADLKKHILNKWNPCDDVVKDAMKYITK